MQPVTRRYCRFDGSLRQTLEGNGARRRTVRRKLAFLVRYDGHLRPTPPHRRCAAG